MLRRAILIGMKADRVELYPVLSFVGAFQERALFDAGVDRFRIVGIEGDEFRVRDMRRRRKGPLRHRRYGTQGRHLAPVKPEIFADEQMRRLCPGINSNFVIDDGGSQAVDIVNRYAVIAPLPGLAAVGAGMH